MRELKFRAWDKIFNVMLDDIMPFQPSIIVSGITFDYCYGEKAADRYQRGVDEGGPEHYCITDYEIEIMQFTGLKDKNGVQIYQDDIVHSPLTGIGAIVWLDYHGWSFKSCDTSMWMREEVWKSFEVIGNIYENHELLKP